jgi:HlyD family secretion protein
VAVLLVPLALALFRPATTSPPARGQGVTKGAAARSEIRALARLEPESGAIVVGARPGVRVEKVLVEEGKEVQEGDLLAILEGHEQHTRQLEVAVAQRAAANFKRVAHREELALERETFDRLKQTRLDTLRKLVADLRAKVGPEPAAAKGAKPEEKGATPSTSGMGGAGMVPPVVRDAAAAQLHSELAKSEVQLKELETAIELLPRRRALEDKLAADDSPEWKVLDRQVELAQADVSQSRVVAPVAGRVLAVNARAGEVSSGGMLTLGDIRSIVARAEVFQSDALDVAVGDPVQVTILGRTVAGEVTRVGSLIARNGIQALDPTALSDRRVIEVIVKLADAEPAARLINMQVEVAIRKRTGSGTTPAR